MPLIEGKYATNFLIILNLFLTVQIYEARPPSTSERIVASTRKTDCGNILRLIDNQRDLFECLIHAYNLDEQEVIFPNSGENNEESDEQPPTLPHIRGIPPCARKGNTFCEDIDNYPYNKVQTLLKMNNSLNSFFGVDASPDDFVNRVGVDDEKFLCEADHKLIFPKIGKTKDNTWQYIVNQEKSPEGYIQGIRIETCRFLNEPCELFNSIPSGYVTSCKQKYMYRRLLSLNRNGITVNEYFELPSSCCCSYKRDYHFLLRNGGSKSSLKKNKFCNRSNSTNQIYKTI